LEVQERRIVPQLEWWGLFFIIQNPLNIGELKKYIGRGFRRVEKIIQILFMF
jgi:hypothetical protein